MIKKIKNKKDKQKNRFSKKKFVLSISSIITIIILILIAVVFTGLFITWANNSSSQQISESRNYINSSVSSVKCSNAKPIFISCEMDFVTDKLSIHLNNRNDFAYSNMKVTIEGIDSTSNKVSAVAVHNGNLESGEIVYLKTGDSLLLENYDSLADLNLDSISRLTLTSVTCPNNPIVVQNCD